jgi:hypothetical protein
MVRTSRPARTSLLASALPALVVALGVACSGKTLPFPGGLMLAIQTDLSAPKDVAAVGLYITSDGRPIFSDVREVAPTGEVRFPATIAIVADEARPRAQVKIRVIAFKDSGEVRVLRDILTTVPKGRTGLLRAPLLWINEGSGSGSRLQLSSSLGTRDGTTPPDGFTAITSACPDGQTFLEGECGDARVDGDALPDFQEKEVFGGGDGSGKGGRCFDVLGCFAGAAPVDVDASTCSASLGGTDAASPNLSFAVALPASAQAGECKDGTCLVPLDKGVGWNAGGLGVTFPKALCARIASGKALGIVRSTTCATKDATVPSCGPASSVVPGGTGGPGGTDGGAAVGAQDFEAPLAFTGEPNLSAVAIDEGSVFVARSAANPPPSGVVKLSRADVQAQKSTAQVAVVFGYANPQNSTLAIGPAPKTQYVVARGESGDVHVCTPASAGNCPSFRVLGAPVAPALSATDVYVYGVSGSVPQLNAISLATPTLVPRAVVPGPGIASLVHVGSTLYLGGYDGSILKCADPCETEASLSQVRAAPSAAVIVTALAATDALPGKLFFIQVPTSGQSFTVGGVFEIDDTGNGQRQLGSGADLGGPSAAGTASAPAALAVDAEYVYWGGGFDDPGGNGRKFGVLRRSHKANVTTEPFLEQPPATEPVTGLAVDGTHVFWTYNRPDKALVFARKKRSF